MFLLVDSLILVTLGTSLLVRITDFVRYKNISNICLNIKQLSRMERGVLPYSQCVNVSFYQTDSLSLLIITSLSCEL